MTSLLSNITKEFGKPIVLASLLPAAIFVMLNLLVIVPALPDGLPPAPQLLGTLETEETGWQAAAVLFVTAVIASILFNLNIPLIRLYEGYAFRDSRLGRWLEGRQREKYRALRDEIDSLYRLCAAGNSGLDRCDAPQTSLAALEHAQPRHPTPFSSQ